MATVATAALLEVEQAAAVETWAGSRAEALLVSCGVAALVVLVAAKAVATVAVVTMAAARCCILAAH